ncbi:hypothetical protein ACJMK2_011415 [Sinanodonta woodiana]|uniref:Fringe-like glycosyltransferase domain-containing protein n=1 Tax=Sinanodonta woodiana TaxID=1069815 RepID=A0ABD3V820_SINWO
MASVQSRDVYTWVTCIFLLFQALVWNGYCDEFEESIKKLETLENDASLANIVFFALTQSEGYHANRAKAFQKHFNDQIKHLEKENRPLLYLSHKKWADIGTWTLFPLLTIFAEKFSKKSWFFICEEETRIDLPKLRGLLQQFNSSQDLFLGKPLRDQEPTIIHHFSDPKLFTYPDPAAGFLLSYPLVKKLADRLPDTGFRTDFNIDPKHELAKYIYQDGNGVRMTEVPELCTDNENAQCVTSYPVKFPDCGKPVKEGDFFVAVKTCEKYHKDRVSVVKNTWGKETENIEYYSHVEDPSIPTIDLGVQNTEHGHCGKTLAIMKRFISNPKTSQIPWLIIVDDDTIISIKRLKRLLACYDSSQSLAVGERYGYNVVSGIGYSYITGGGGMIFSNKMAQKFAAECPCPRDDSPDDMILGLCLKRFGIPVTHTPYLHQARPNDYSVDFLSHQIPVSFHKHWMNDPYQVYQMLQDEGRSSSDEDHEQYVDTRKDGAQSDGHDEL